MLSKEECHREESLTERSFFFSLFSSPFRQISNKYKMPLVPFSGGTSLESHFTCPYGGISLDVSNMNEIKELHAADGDMVVGAGCRWEDINAWLEEQGHDLFFPLDPGPAATVGGMISTGCSGTNAVR